MEKAPVRRARSRGFTLVEVLVVVAIVGIMAALAGANLQGVVDGQRVGGAARMLLADLENARLRAIAQGVPWCVCIEKNNGDPRVRVYRKPALVLEPSPTDRAHLDASDRIAEERLFSRDGGGAFVQLDPDIFDVDATVVMFNRFGTPWVGEGAACESSSLAQVAMPMNIGVAGKSSNPQKRSFVLAASGTMELQ